MIIVAGKSAVVGEVFCRVHSGKLPKIVDEMRLVKVSAIDGYSRPIDPMSSLGFHKRALKS